MRVISGSLKGHTLFAPKGKRIRPTSDHVKETLFNMIGPRVVRAFFLDVFAGTGSIGIEALSRDAAEVLFVEKAPAHVRVLKRNLTVCAVESGCQVYCADANRILKVLQKEGRCFDIVFLDPPYRQTNMLKDMLQRLTSMSLVSEAGLIVAEHAHTFVPPSVLEGGFFLTKHRQIGDTTLSFYRVEVS